MQGRAGSGLAWSMSGAAGVAGVWMGLRAPCGFAQQANGLHLHASGLGAHRVAVSSTGSLVRARRSKLDGLLLQVAEACRQCPDQRGCL